MKNIVLMQDEQGVYCTRWNWCNFFSCRVFKPYTVVYEGTDYEAALASFIKECQTWIDGTKMEGTKMNDLQRSLLDRRVAELQQKISECNRDIEVKKKELENIERTKQNYLKEIKTLAETT